MDDMARNMKGQFKLADRLGAKYTIVLGDDEIKNGKAMVKTMATSEQQEVPFDELEAFIRK
jgi:histidyl-tRNA synthetase